MVRLLKLKLIDWFVPKEMRADPQRRSQAFRAVVFGLAMAFWAPVFAPIYLILGSPSGCVMIAVAGTSIFLSIVSLRFTQSVFVTGQAIATSVFLVLIGLGTITGGLGSPSLWWLTSVPIIGLILCGIPSGFFWASLSCISCLGFFICNHIGVNFAEEISEGNLLFLNWSATSGIILCAFSLTFAFKLSEDAARKNLEAARVESEMANKVKSAFLANMSHEIRTPMSAILGLSELLTETELTPSQRELLSTIVESGDNLLTIINDILDLSRIEADKMVLEKVPFSLEDSLFDALRSLSVAASEKQLELLGNISPQEPHVVGDPVRLRQILVNLIGNSIKFTETGEVSVDIKVMESATDAATVVITVFDTGIGIPADRIDHIFDAFEQADSTSTRRFGGTGLGLAIVSRLVQLMDGRIDVTSDEGEWTQFRVELPFALQEDGDPPRPQDSNDITRGFNLKNTRILVVDDYPSCRTHMQQTFRAMEVTCDTASSLPEAIEKINEAETTGRTWDVVLIDGLVLSSDGSESLDKIGKAVQSLDRVIVMQQPATCVNEITWADHLGTASRLSKPIKPSELFSALQAVLHQTEGAVAPTPNAPTPPPISPLRVLLAEDSVVNQKLASELLRKHGHSVVIANNGLEAVEAMRSEMFDLVLMDIQMPKMDGYDATAAIREHEAQSGRRTPIIALTAHAMLGDREKCLEAGMDDYVTKPIRMPLLFESISRIQNQVDSSTASE